MAFNPIQPLQLKNKNFRQVTVIQILLIFFVLTIGDITASFHTAFADTIVTSGLLILEGIYLLMLLQLVKFLRPESKSNLLIKITIGAIFVISIIALNPFVEIVNDKVPWLIVTHILLCSIECFVIALGLNDIYSSDIHISADI